MFWNISRFNFSTYWFVILIGHVCGCGFDVGDYCCLFLGGFRGVFPAEPPWEMQRLPKMSFNQTHNKLNLARRGLNLLCCQESVTPRPSLTLKTSHLIIVNQNLTLDNYQSKLHT